MIVYGAGILVDSYEEYEGRYLTIGIYGDKVLYDRGARYVEYDKVPPTELWSIFLSQNRIEIITGETYRSVEGGKDFRSRYFGTVRTDEVFRNYGAMHPCFWEE